MTAPPLAPDLRRYRTSTTLSTRGATETQGLPAGVIGQVEGIALVYGVIDTYGTTFARGCLDRTCRERVAGGKVRLFLDHGDVPSSGMYDTHLHIGTVREVVDEQGPDGKWHARFRADLFDTIAGREAHEYLRAVAATGSETGVSIGMLKEPDTVRCVVDGQEAFRVAEVALGEISITSMSSVPGTRVTSVRQAGVEEPKAVEEPKVNPPAEPPPVVEPAPPITTESTVTHSGLRFKVTTVADGSVPPPTVTIEPLDAPPASTEPPNYFALLDGLVAHLGHTAVRAHLSPILSAEDTEHSNAASGAPVSADSNGSNAASQDVTRDGSEPTAPNVTMPERLAFLRASFLSLNQ